MKATEPFQIRQAAMVVELKGDAGTQRALLPLNDQWTQIRPVDWARSERSRSGRSVTPAGSEPAEGTVYLEGHFDAFRCSKLGSLFAARVAGVLLISLLGATVIALPRVFSMAARQRDARSRRCHLVRQAAAGFRLWRGRHLCCQRHDRRLPWGTRIRWKPVGLPRLALAGAGSLSGQVWAHRQAPDTGEVFQNMLVTGLLAASSSSLLIFQVPTSWTEVFLLAALWPPYSSPCSECLSPGVVRPASGPLGGDDRRHALRRRRIALAGSDQLLKSLGSA